MDFVIFNNDIAAWQTFAAIGILFMFFEVFAPGFILLPIGVACLLTIPFTFYFSEALSQLSFLGINLIIVFTFFIKIIKPKLNKTEIKTNVDSMIGNVCEVTEAFANGRSGYIKLFGDRWQAYCETDDSFAVGDRAKIIKLDGNKVVVKKI